MRPVRLILIVLGSLVAASVARAQTPARPNILWLTVEDMSPWLACYGDETVATPNLDRLAARGVRYTNAFATSPVCAPARSALLTAMWPTRIGSMQMRTGSRSRDAEKNNPGGYADIPLYEAVPPAFVRCFPQLLRASGYYCTNNSKQDYQFRAPVTVWDDSSRNAHWRHRGSGQPFFAVFNHGGTHESQAFPNARRRPELVTSADVDVPPFYPDTPVVRDTLARTYNNIAAMDTWVGQRLQELDDAGFRDSTIVFFYSDHGVGLPRGKRDLYDTGVRVPLIIRWPDGRGAGTTSDRIVQFNDFGPTVLSLAGLRPDARLDGVAFLGQFAGAPRTLAFLHGDRMDLIHDTQRGASDGRFKYIRNYNPDLPLMYPQDYRNRLAMMEDIDRLRELGPRAPEQWQMTGGPRPIEEFYDTRDDPWEVRNLAADPAHVERMGAMRHALEAWIEETGDLGFVLPETVLVRDHIWPPDGVQPTTATPVVVELPDGRVTVSCETDGASIGYRFEDAEQWTVYTGPFPRRGDGPIQLIAHRIGWKPARVTAP